MPGVVPYQDDVAESLRRGTEPVLRDFTGVVASFTDANPFGSTSDFTATIAWGDGHSGTGRVTGDRRGGFPVQGTYTYT
jgi:hypothetical protein